MVDLNIVREFDPIVADYIEKEINRQRYKIELLLQKISLVM